MIFALDRFRQVKRLIRPMSRSAEHRLGSMAGCLKLAGAAPGAPFARLMDSMREIFRGSLYLLVGLQRNPWDALQNDGPSPRPSPHRMGRGRRLGFWRVVAEAANLAVCFSACAATAGDAKFQAAAFYFKRVLTCEIAAGPHCG